MAKTQPELELLAHKSVRDLIARGALIGQVSYAQINDLLIDLELDEESAETLFEILEKRAIAIVDEAPQPAAATKAPKGDTASVASAPTKPKKTSNNADLDAILADLDAIEVNDDIDSVAQFLAEEELYVGEDLDDEMAPVEDALKIYLNRMGRISRLSWDEERELARVARDGSPEESREAKNALVEANLRLVVHMAKSAGARTTLSITDLLQEGNIGLLDAVERYRPESKKTFGAYATWWIRRAMNRAINEHARIMRLSGELYSAIQKLQTAQRELTQKLGRTPSREEIAEATGLTVEQIAEAQRAAQRPLSLDSPSGDGDETMELGEMIADPENEITGERAERREMHDSLTALLDDLTEREKTIVMMRFGLGEYASTGPQAVEDVANSLGVSRERLHDLELRALRKLRKKAKGAGLDQLLG